MEIHAFQAMVGGVMSEWFVSQRPTTRTFSEGTNRRGDLPNGFRPEIGTELHGTENRERSWDHKSATEQASEEAPGFRHLPGVGPLAVEKF